MRLDLCSGQTLISHTLLWLAYWPPSSVQGAWPAWHVSRGVLLQFVGSVGLRRNLGTTVGEQTIVVGVRPLGQHIGHKGLKQASTPDPPCGVKPGNVHAGKRFQLMLKLKCSTYLYGTCLIAGLPTLMR